MSSHNADRESDEEEEEDFLPVLPEMIPATAMGSAEGASDSASGARAEKRPRSPADESPHGGGTAGAASHSGDDCNSGCNAVNVGKSLKREYSATDMLSAEGYPSPGIYERSYWHGSAVHDIGTLTDENGALILTVDVAGSVCAWRKLPRGVFFMGQFCKFFSKVLTAEECGRSATHHILSDRLNSRFFLVRMSPHMDEATNSFVVLVEITRVNCVLLSLEGRLSFQFKTARRNDAVGGHLSRQCVLTRPFLVYHDYQPHVIFFTALDDERSGVILLSCVAEKNPLFPLGASDEGGTKFVPALPLSTANPIVCCQQHQPSGLVVLVDAEGIVDYARIVEYHKDGGNAGLSLKIVGGAPASCAGDPMKLRQWITFERRQKTGFFALLREASNAARLGRSMVPLSVDFSPSGKFFIISSAFLCRGSVSVHVHLFEFTSGAYLCSDETDEVRFPRLSEESAIRDLKASLRGSVYNAVVEDTLCRSPGGVWVFVPEITEAIVPNKRVVCGRRIITFRATLGAEDAESKGRLFRMEKLSRSIGDTETQIYSSALHSSLPTTHIGLDNFSVPLRLLRAAVQPTQTLKNLVSQSPVGCALSQEDIKRLFGVHSENVTSILSVEREGSIRDDSTFCTTSLTGGALLLYTKFEPSLSVAELEDTNIPDASEGAKNGKDEGLRPELLLSKLYKKRDFDCSDLQMLQSLVDTPSSCNEESKKVNVKGEEVGTKAHGAEKDTSGSDGELEECRVRNIISSAAIRTMSWGGPAVRATISIREFGAIELRLLPQIAPKAVTNFASLSKRGFYDALTFHRVIPGFMIQGGCPLGNGTGGESSFGAPFEDEGFEVMEFFSYPTVQWLCMANRGANTNESQFFITVGEALPWLNAKHTVLGFVTSGKSVVLSISNVERDSDDKPLVPVVMDHVEVVEGK
uniref:peptidylprolyl isomerase n=1 Tax=Trypanosoma congolense (strain IL3000) TaxID=1068625 RepID=G0UY85_TRYCI|nr:unnamed protein product [Trypanosoma congolense IL3000]